MQSALDEYLKSRRRPFTLTKHGLVGEGWDLLCRYFVVGVGVLVFVGLPGVGRILFGDRWITVGVLDGEG
jgi:hypothetical protein